MAKLLSSGCSGAMRIGSGSHPVPASVSRRVRREGLSSAWRRIGVGGLPGFGHGFEDAGFGDFAKEVVGGGRKPVPHVHLEGGGHRVGVLKALGAASFLVLMPLRLRAAQKAKRSRSVSGS
jgi:hypothetical protein